MSKQISTSRKPRWFWRGTQCLLLLMCCLCLVPLVQRAQSQRVAVEAIEDLGGSVTYDFERLRRAEPPGPKWLRSWVGDHYFMRVDIVMFWDSRTTDESLKYLRHLRSVKKLYLDGTQVTDAGLVHLEHLGDLQLLGLAGTRVTEKAKSRLREKLPHCRIR